jgi:hypothetical protein
MRRRADERTGGFQHVSQSDCIMNNSFRFKERFDGDSEYSGKIPAALGWFGRATLSQTSSISICTNFSVKGPGLRQVEMELSSNTLSSHLNDSPLGVYKKAHRHGPGAYTIVLGGRS